MINIKVFTTSLMSEKMFLVVPLSKVRIMMILKGRRDNKLNKEKI
mgnify:CR=1 FL=1